MYLKNEKTSWTLHFDFSWMIDFCIWTLTKDGMHIPPFSTHLPGDGSLSLRGMQTQEWLEWLKNIVDFQDQPGSVVSDALLDSLALPNRVPLIPSAPVGIWKGSLDVQQRLQELWEEYRLLMGTRKKWMGPLALKLRNAERQIWNDLQSYHSRIPSLTIYFVAYPQQITLPVYPSSIIITVVDGSIDSEHFYQQILLVAKQSF